MHCPKIGKLFVLVNTRKNSCKNLLFKKCESSLIKFLGKSENVLVVRVQPDFVSTSHGSRSLWKSPVPEGVEHARFSQSGNASFMPFGKKLRHATEYGH